MTQIAVATDHKERRSHEWPSVGEQLGAIWKILHALEMGETPPADAIAIQDQIDNIKAKYEKGV